MKILFVLECANWSSNGTTATCNRFAEELIKKGHEVKVVGCQYLVPSEKPDHYVEVPYYKFPVFEGIIHKEGFNFCRCHPRYLVDSIKWADVVHVLLPMKFGNTARLLAMAYKKPVTTAFHLQPQNITSAIHMQRARVVNAALYYGFRRYLYHGIRRIHCPSEMIARELRRHGYRKNDLYVISNGVIPFFHRIGSERPKEYEGKTIVVMSGRLSSEKRQDLIIKAVARSKYNKNIQVILCGQGPKKAKYEKLAAKWGLANPLVMKFCNSEELRNILCYTDIYIHASDFEIEGISCLEAIACGVVPIISNAKASATSSFALHPESIFKHGSWRDLMRKIDWFIEHEDVRKQQAAEYEALGKEYALDRMVDKMEAFLAGAIEDNEKGINFKPNRRDLRKIRKLFAKLKKDGLEDSEPPIFAK